MSTARYLLRFDDLCPSSNWSTWEPVEAALVSLGLRPMVAVVPRNTDAALVCGPADPEFWERVRRWQSLGWHIALHGYEHRYWTSSRGLAGLRPRSEFAGVLREHQARMLDDGLSVFAAHRVRADGWIAPGHSFDATTIELLRDRNVDVLSDGFDLLPHTDRRGMFWIPCQMWNLVPRPVGLWTVCLHTNGWDETTVKEFVDLLERYRDAITDVETVRDEYEGRRRGPLDRAYAAYRRTRLRLA